MKPKKKNNAFQNSEFLEKNFDFSPACLRSGPQWKSLTIRPPITSADNNTISPLFTAVLGFNSPHSLSELSDDRSGGVVSEGVEPGVVAGLALCDVTKGPFPEAFVLRAHFFGRSWIHLFSADGGKVSLASYGTLTVRRVTPARRPRQQNQTQALSLMTGPLGLKLSVNDGADWCVGGSFGGAARK